MDKTINTTEELVDVLQNISFVNSVLDFKWKFECKEIEVLFCGDGDTKDGWLVWVSFERPDTDTGMVGRGRGRDEIIWRGTSLSGVVKTCWLLVELMVRHELMEGFRWDDARIFNPHNTVQALAEIQNESKRSSETKLQGTVQEVVGNTR